MTTSRGQAILSLRPDSEFVLSGTKLKWLDSKTTQPTDSEIDAEVTRLDQVYTDVKYKRDRAAEYPTVVDQLDLIYHSGIDAWKTKIKETKDKYPKP